MTKAFETDLLAKPHLGQNIKRLREMLGIKQEALALQLGNDWTQRRISLLEQKEEVEDKILEEIAAALKISPEAIKAFSEEAAINIIGNTVTNTNHDNGALINYRPTFDPIEKIMALYQEKEMLFREQTALYERMLKEKEVMMEKLEQLLNKH